MGSSKYTQHVRQCLQLEKKIDYIFGEKNLLRQAFLHASYVNEQKYSDTPSNERLEFLGDAVLDLVISEWLMELSPHETEGFLSQKRSALVQEKSLAAVAKKAKLSEYLLMGKGELNSGGQFRDSVMADCLEALLGAIYLDSGLDSVRSVVRKLFSGLIDNMETLHKSFNFKSQLQHFSQSHGFGVPVYKLISREGPSHEPKFKVAVYINSKKISLGSGTSIKKAEQKASHNALKKYKQPLSEGF